MLAFFGISLLDVSGTVKIILGIVCGVCSSFSIGAMFAVAYSIPSQLAADDEARTGRSHAAMYFAVQGLFSGIASGIGAVDGLQERFGVPLARAKEIETYCAERIGGLALPRFVADLPCAKRKTPLDLL